MSGSSSSSCLFIEQNNNKITEPLSRSNDTCVLQSNTTINVSSGSFNRSFLTDRCDEQCNETGSVALVSFLEDEIGPYLSCNDGPIRACHNPYLVFNTHSSALLLYQPLYHKLPFSSSFWTLSNTLGTFEACAYGNSDVNYIFEEKESNCTLDLSWLCLCPRHN